METTFLVLVWATKRERRMENQDSVSAHLLHVTPNPPFTHMTLAAGHFYTNNTSTKILLLNLYQRP